MEYTIGIAISMLIEYLKERYGTESRITMLALLGASVAAATAYHFLSQTVYWETVLTVLASSAAFHNLVLRHLKPAQE